MKVEEVLLQVLLLEVNSDIHARAHFKCNKRFISSDVSSKNKIHVKTLLTHMEILFTSIVESMRAL